MLPANQSVLDYELWTGYYEDMPPWRRNLISWDIIRHFDTYFPEWTWEKMTRVCGHLVELYRYLNLLRITGKTARTLEDLRRDSHLSPRRQVEILLRERMES